MPTMYDDADVKCPFYLSSRIGGGWHNEISCEGIVEDSVILLRFKTPAKMRMHCEIFCNEHYKNCEIFRMLEEKYED